jgi:uncharacterized protein YjeT (DUF2065 family)
MIADIVVIFGCVAVIEGLVLALAPSRFEDLLAWLSTTSIPTRRNLGLSVVAGGVVTVWLGKVFLAIA